MGQVEKETKKIQCNVCKVVTNHLLQARYSWLRQIRDESENDSGEVVGTCDHRYSVWTCAGCETVTFEWQLVYDDGFEGDGAYLPTYEVQHKVFRNLSKDIYQLYIEVFSSFQRDCLLLCTVGLRALIEAVCADKGLDGGNLEKRIEGLIKFLPSMNLIEALHSCRLAGNRAVHRLEALTRDEAALALGIVEDILNFLYDLDYKASRMGRFRTGASHRSGPGSVQ